MKIIQSIFTRFELTAQEQITGRIFNDTQLGIMQTLRADAVEQRVNLDFTPNDVLGFTQQEAFLKGQIALLTNLIDGSAAAQREILESKSPQQSQ